MSLEKLSRRSFLIASAATGLAAALAACAPKATPAPAAEAPAEQPAEKPAEQPAPATQEEFTVRFMCRAGARNIPTYEKVIAEDFIPNNPGIKVQIEPAPDGWVEKLLAQMIAGTAVDLFQAWGNIFFNWVERDLLLDCQPYVEATMTDAEIADYNDFQWEGLMMRGRRVGMPKYINIMTIRLSKDCFEEYGVPLPPEDGEWDHDDYREMVCALTEAARSAGNNGQWGGWLPGWSWDRFWNHIHMFGGKVVDEKYGKKCMLGEPEAQEALKWMYDLQWVDNCHAQPSQVENQWPIASMVSGFVCTAEDGTYPITVDEEYEGKLRWDMRHVPKGPTGIRSVLGTTDAWSITKQTGNADASWALLKFLSGPIYQAKGLIGLEGRLPVLKSLQSNWLTTVREIRPSLNDVRLETAVEALEWGYPEDTPWFDKQTEATQLITPALEKVFTVGDVGPEYFIEVCKEVDATQI